MARKTNSKKLGKKILILGEGKSERQYFVEMKKTESLSIEIQPELPRKPYYRTIFSAAEYYSDYYLKVFCLIDLDYIVRDGLFMEYNNRKQAIFTRCKNVQVFESYPCLETWFAFHFEEFSREFVYCDDLIDNKLEIKNRFKDYKKGNASKKYYNQLKPLQRDAAIRSQRACQNRLSGISSGMYQENRCQLPFTDIYKIVQELLVI